MEAFLDWRWQVPWDWMRVRKEERFCRGQSLRGIWLQLDNVRSRDLSAQPRRAANRQHRVGVSPAVN